MVGQLRLSRNQIAQIVGNDPEAIKQFEQLFSNTDTSATLIEEASLIASSAESTANEALSAVNRLAEEMDLAPVPQEHTRRTAYGWFSDTTDQAAAAINTAYAMTFNTTGWAQDVRIGSPTSRIYVDRKGAYNIQFSAQFQNTGGGANRVWVWLAINGTAVADSATVLRLQGNNTEQVAAWNFIANLLAGDYFELMWEVSDTAVGLFADAASAVHPAIPSVLLSVTDNI